MTSYHDVTNNVYSVTMTTIRHCSIQEFGRGASNQAVAPGITRPLHATESNSCSCGEIRNIDFKFRRYHESTFNKNAVIALQVQFACQFGLIDVTLHLTLASRTSICRASFTTFGSITCGSFALSNVHHNIMLLVINTDVARGHMGYAHAPQNKINC